MLGVRALVCWQARALALVYCSILGRWAAAQQVEDVYPIAGFTANPPSPRPFPFNETTGYPYYTAEVPNPADITNWVRGTYLPGTQAFSATDGTTIAAGLPEYPTVNSAGESNAGVMVQVYVCEAGSAPITAGNPTGEW
eukprot:COSAG05_NODE_5866_length_1070_cov_1.112255_2_plen_139_part_00